MRRSLRSERRTAYGLSQNIFVVESRSRRVGTLVGSPGDLPPRANVGAAERYDALLRDLPAEIGRFHGLRTVSQVPVDGSCSALRSRVVG